MHFHHRCDTFIRKKYSSPTSTPNLDFTSYYMCQQFTDKVLLAPSTAEYQSSDEVLRTMIYDPQNNTYKMQYYVDSSNSFGVMIRNNFYCKVKHGEGDTWFKTELMLLE
ncbi:MAG: hypothetical protein ABFD00_04835 [Chloroherpetonaceae bacterium]